MADFCRQCNQEDFGRDQSDYPSGRAPCAPGYGYPEICEGCGFVSVNEKGECVSTRRDGCLRGHGDKI